MWQPTVDGPGPIYQALVAALEADVEAGRLQPGDQLPPQRELARALGVSLGTVTRAYAEAESRGLAYGEVGRGTFAGRKPSSDRFGESSSNGIDLSRAWPLYGLDPDLGAALRQISRRPDVERLLEYGPNAGHRPHRVAGSQWAAHQGIHVEESRIVVCIGAQHALTAVLGSLLEPGDVLLTEPVTYPGLRAVAAALRLRLVGVPMDREGLIPDALERACENRRPRAVYMIPTIQNPTACILGEERRREIARIARLHGVAIIEDEVHRLLHPAPPPALSTIAPDITHTVLSLSKVVAGGIRVAFLIVPPGQAERIGHMVWATSWMAPPLTAEVAALWIQDGTAVEAATRKRREAQARQEIAAEVLAEHSYRTATHSYHVWMPLPGQWKAAEFVLACERRGVAVSASDTFAVSRERVENAVRLSLSGPSTREELQQGLERVGELLGSRPPTAAVL